MAFTEEEMKRMRAQAAALAQMESAGGDISGMTLDSISPPTSPDAAQQSADAVSEYGRQQHQNALRAIGAPFSVPKPPDEAFIISRPEPQTVEVPPMPRPDDEFRAARNADIDAYNKRALEMGFRQLVAGLTGTQAPEAVSQLGTGEKDLLARRRQATLDALRKMEAENNAARTDAYLSAQDKMGAGRTAAADAKSRELDLKEQLLKNKMEGDAWLRKYKEEGRRAAAGLAAQKMSAKEAKDAAKASDVTGLRKELNALEPVKTFGNVTAAYGKIKAAIDNPSAASDLSAIFAYMKMLDPGSTVREGEFANAQNATGVGGKIINAYNKVLSGERLSPEQRADFLAQARGLYEVEKKRYDEQVSRYRDLAKKRGGNPDDVMPLRTEGGSSAPAPGKIHVTNGQETLEIDEADLPAAEADGFKRVK